MNDLEIRHAVHSAGDDISPAFRRELADTLRAEVAGEAMHPVAPVVRLDADRRRRRRRGLWGGLGLVGVAAATVTALAIRHDEQAGVVVTGTGPDATSSATVSAPSAEPATTTPGAAPSPTEVTDTTVVPPAPLDPAAAPGATSQGSAVISPDSLKQPLVPVRVVDLDVAAVPLDRYDLTPPLSFLPDGGLLVLDRQTAIAQVVDPAGTTRWTVDVPPTLDGAIPWDASLGPDDVLYVSYVNGDAAAPDSFTLAAVPTSGPSAGVVVEQWSTEWQCVEGTCGEVTLEATGIRVLWQEGDGALAPYVDATGQPSGRTYDVTTLEQRTTATDLTLPPDYVDSTGYGAFSAGAHEVTLGADTWHLEALGVRFIEGSFTWASEQPDGSVLALVATTKDSALQGVTTLARMLPGGAIEQYLPPQLAYLDVASIGGILYAVQPAAVDSGTGYTLVALVADGGTNTGTVATVVPTTTPAAESGLPPAVVALPVGEREAAKGEDRLAVADGGVPLTSVLAMRTDGSGDVFATRQGADEDGVLVIVRADGTVVDLGIPIGPRGGVVSSNDDRLYVWDRTASSADDQSLTWTVYEPSGTDAWTPWGTSMRQISAGACTFYVSGESCRSAAQAAPLVPGDSVDWAVASPDLTTLTVSIGGTATTRELVEPDLDRVVCFDIDCSFKFTPGSDGMVFGWHQVEYEDGTTRTAVIGMHPDGTSIAVWLPGTDWSVVDVGAAALAWHLGADGLVDSITSWPMTGL